ncbi:dUTP diphosphatase [Halobacillus amylolyticus]|uniref:dUTP diphosphatase n=1 Tax=Halobacillus amylolyticus TaxID=2932259 RepID=A0ABY4HBI8_9BACI|nr:dUTP diphosphatase [Halobacillus amylolyticus]UOR11974.1 dUTP diphosphatase [Halobacillus amylolyticus]
MNWEPFYHMQQQLDKHIESTHNLEAVDIVDNKILALLVEIGELANETRCFKFWSKKTASSKNIVLEEYVDGLHFILSLGLDLGIRYQTSTLNDVTNETQAFLTIFTTVENFKRKKDQASYTELFTAFLSLGEILGFQEEELQEAYKRKNEVNFKRQDEGY